MSTDRPATSLQKSFFCGLFELEFKFLADGQLKGKLTPSVPGLVHEFNGFFDESNKSEILVAFFIEWKLFDVSSLYLTSFSGVITSVANVEILKLSWLLVDGNDDSSFAGALEMPESDLSRKESKTLNDVDQLMVPYPRSILTRASAS